MSEQKRHRRGRRKSNIDRFRKWFTRLSKGKKIAVCAGSAVLCIAVGIVIYAAVLLGKINTDDISGDDIIMNEEAAIAGTGYTNVALFGIDSRSGELEKGTRTDCLIVASLNNETKEVKMISVYRDTVLDIEDNYLQKCNAAYAFGGPTQAINMLNKNLDLNITDYATVDFAAIANAIDLLGGLEIDVKPEEIKTLNKYVKETARVAGKTANEVAEPGLQLLDGVQATTYARIRSTAGGDFTRTERQRLVIEKIVEKAQKSDLATINSIIDAVLPTIKTSFSATEILSYAKDFMKYEIAESDGFPFEKTTATISGLGSIVIPVTLSENVSELHRVLYGTENYEPSATVAAINDAIIARVGQREATDYSTLSQKTYVDTAEDKAQEKNEYTPPPQTTTDDDVDVDVSVGTNTDKDTGKDKGEKPSADKNDTSKEETATDKPSNNKPSNKPETPKPDEQKPDTPSVPDTGGTDSGVGTDTTPAPSEPDAGGSEDGGTAPGTGAEPEGGSDSSGDSAGEAGAAELVE